MIVPIICVSNVSDNLARVKPIDLLKQEYFNSDIDLNPILYLIGLIQNFRRARQRRVVSSQDIVLIDRRDSGAFYRAHILDDLGVLSLYWARGEALWQKMD